MLLRPSVETIDGVLQRTSQSSYFCMKRFELLLVCQVFIRNIRILLEKLLL